MPYKDREKQLAYMRNYSQERRDQFKKWKTEHNGKQQSGSEVESS